MRGIDLAYCVCEVLVLVTPSEKITDWLRIYVLCKGFFWYLLCLYNLGQSILDKFTELSKIGFSMICVVLQADFFVIFQYNCQNLPFG